jgi:hypothetical protein
MIPAMWLIGILGAFTFAAVAILLLGRGQSAAPRRPEWDVALVAQRYIFIVGSLSGFSVASATFLAGFTEHTGSPALLTVIGMFLTAFVAFVGTAMIFAIVPANPLGEKPGEGSVEWQHTVYIFGNCGFYIGIALSWFALRPFLLAINLDFLADIYTWIVLFAALVGAARHGLHLYLLTAHTALACISLPIVGFGVALLYRFVLVPYFPALWPQENASLLLSVMLFALMALMFTADTFVLAFGPRHRLARWLINPKSGALLIYVQVLIVAVGLLWASISGLG